MKRMIASLGVLLFTAGLALAGTWTGRLLDANCATRQTSAACAPTSATTAFAVDVNGKILKLDAEGNKKAAEAFQSYNSSAERAKEPNSQNSPVTATIQGTMKGNQLMVDSIDIR
jgi:predicted RNA methylase